MSQREQSGSREFVDGAVEGFVYGVKHSEPYRRWKLKAIAMAFFIAGLLVAVVASSSGVAEVWLMAGACIAIGMLVWRSANKDRPEPS